MGILMCIFKKYIFLQLDVYDTAMNESGNDA